MQRLEPRVKRLEAQMHKSEKRVKVGEFGYATLSEVRELLAAVAKNAGKFEVKP